MPASILIVEDNPANLELMSYLLRAIDHEVLTATNGRQGLDAARSNLPDLIVCDIQMAEIDGYELARRLKKDSALRSIPLVAVTAFAMVGDRETAFSAGFDAYIAKPIEPDRFIAEIERLLPVRRRAPARNSGP